MKVGFNATEVLKRHNLPKELDGLCLSIVTPLRTLDLKANDFQTRNKWVQFFYDRVLKEKFEEENILKERFTEKYSQIPQHDEEAFMRQSTHGQVSTRYKKY